MDNIILIVMQSSGKCSVGVAEKGEDGFLVIEDQVNADLEAERSVIAPGGSVVYCENAMKHYKEIGKLVYLQTCYQTITERIGDPKKRGVVLREGQTLKDLYEERRVLFEKYADVTICEDGLTLSETIGKVVEVFGQE